MIEADDQQIISTDNQMKRFGVLLFGIELFCIIFFFVIGDYNSSPENNFRYGLWADVNIMGFIGFGLLMTFHKQYFYSSIAYTMLIGAISFQLYPTWEILWQKVFDKDINFTIKYDTATLVAASFCTDSILIAFGAIIGKVTPFSLLILTFVQTIGFSLNERIGLQMGITDIGGSMYIHLFGAICGLVVSKIITQEEAFGHPAAKSNYISDLTSVIGTLFLWMYWPSFNAASTNDNSVSQNRSYINTVLSLSASVFATFLVSFLLRKEKKLNMIDVQNATLAGGVAMGTCADIHILPQYAILIGAVAGFISILCYARLQAFLERKIKLHDSCGVLNLHGLPGLFGGICGVLACLQIQSRGDTLDQLKEVFSKAGTNGWSAHVQSLIQFEYILITIVVSTVTGLVCGFLIWAISSPPKTLYSDNENWKLPSVHYDDAKVIYDKIKNLGYQSMLRNQENAVINCPINGNTVEEKLMQK